VSSILSTPQHISITNYFQNTTSQINNRPIWMRTDASNSLSPPCKSFSKCIYRKTCLKLFELHSQTSTCHSYRQYRTTLVLLIMNRGIQSHSLHVFRVYSERPITIAMCTRRIDMKDMT